MDEAVHKFPDLVREHFMHSCVPVNDHAFVMLHAAVWSGGTFIYVPKGVKLDTPLQAYFRMNQERGGQFEHTLIIVDEGADCHYIEGCSAPKYNDSSLHAGCVEIFVKKGAHCRYSSVENWSKNTFNLNTKRALVEADGFMEWIGGNMGSGVTMLYPSSILLGDRARADHLGIAFAGHEQNQDTGAKVVVVGKDCSATVTSKSISRDGGVCSYRGLVKVVKGARRAKIRVQCDGLIIDPKSVANSWPAVSVKEPSARVAHEATVGSISMDRVFYLMSRGLDEGRAMQVIVNGFIEPITKQLPLEYAVEMNKLIEMEMEGAT
jgi:Fe-S cluster assembly protein SufB